MDASEGVIVLFPEDNITREYEKKETRISRREAAS